MSEPTEDQARQGGCCTCPPRCAGADVDEEQWQHGDRPCAPGCVWCFHGCAVGPNLPCFCSRLPVI